MHPNTVTFTIVLLISSTLGAPLVNRPIARRSSQAIFRTRTVSECEANGPCAQAARVVDLEASSDGHRRMQNTQEGGNGPVYTRSGTPIPRIYRRLVLVPVSPAEKNSEPASPDTVVHGPEHSTTSDAPSEPADDPPDSSSNVPPNAAPPTTTSSSKNGTEPADAIKADEPVALMPGPVVPSSLPALRLKKSSPEKADATESNVPEPNETPAGSATNANAGETSAAKLPPAQAPFFSQHETSSHAIPKEDATKPSSAQSSLLSTHSTQSVASSTPIPHGTEGSWGGTLTGPPPPQTTIKEVKLDGIVKSLFFDLVYGRFLF